MPEPSTLITAFVVVALMIMGFGTLIFASRNLTRRYEREPGEDGEYDRLYQKFKPEITSDEEYEQGSKIWSKLCERDRFDGPPETRLNEQEFQYCAALGLSLSQYGDKNPWMRVPREEKDAAFNLIANIEEVVRQANELAEEHNLRYFEARRLTESASRTAKRARDLLTGNVESSIHGLIERSIDGLDREIDQAIREAQEGFRLYQAEMEGDIKYDVNVGTLIIRAGGTDDIEEAERLVRQALLQAENPDADQSDTDLPRAKTALATLLWSHHNCKEEALELLKSAFADYDVEVHHSEVADLLRDITALLMSLEKLDAAKDNVALHLGHLRKVYPEHAGPVCEVLLTEAKIWERKGEIREAEATLKRAVQLSAKQTFHPFDYEQCSKALAFFCARHGRYKESVRIFDKLRKVAFGDEFSSFEFLNPDELRVVANCYSACKRTDDATTFNRQASERTLEYERLTSDKSESAFVGNMIFYRSTSWSVQDSLVSRPRTRPPE